MENLLHTPQFRIFFAIQQAVLLQKNLDLKLQIYVRTSVPETLRIPGSFSSFVLLLSSFIQLSARSYQETQLQRLVFITTDLLNQKIIMRITAGGSLLQSSANAVLNDSPQFPGETQQLLSESIKIVQHDFHGSFELVNFPQRGMQVVVTLPTQIGTQSRGRS